MLTAEDESYKTAPLVKRPWTTEEDAALVEAVNKYGACRWSLIATELGSGRIGKQCRERWNNHMCPEVKKSEWSEEEDKAILDGVAQMGTRWCEIIKVSILAGRTDNSIKNRYYSLQRRMKAAARQQEAKGPCLPPMSGSAGAMSDDLREHVMDLVARLAAAAEDQERDLLISKLTAAMHGRAGSEEHGSDDEATESPDFGLSAFPTGALDEVGPDLPPASPLSSEDSSLSERHLPSPTSPPSPADAPATSPAATFAEAAPLAFSPGSPSSSAASPSALESPALRRVRAQLVPPDAAPFAPAAFPRAGFLSGRELRKAQLSPLMVPERGYGAGGPQRISPALDRAAADIAAVDSPKRQRTPTGWTPAALDRAATGTEVPSAALGPGLLLERPELLKRRSSPLSVSTPSSCRSYHTASAASSLAPSSAASPASSVGAGSPIAPGEGPCEASPCASEFLPLRLFSDLLTSPMSAPPPHAKATSFGSAAADLRREAAINDVMVVSA